jgi:hypothetical protein
LFALAVVAAGLAGCAADPSAKAPGPGYVTEMSDGRPGLFGDLRWDVDLSEKRKAAEAAPAQPAGTMGTAGAATAAGTMTAAEAEEFKKWRESAGSTERQEFEQWRAWQEWKRKNPK